MIYKTQRVLSTIYNYTKRQNDKDTTFTTRIYQRLFYGLRCIACGGIFWYCANFNRPFCVVSFAYAFLQKNLQLVVLLLFLPYLLW